MRLSPGDDEFKVLVWMIWTASVILLVVLFLLGQCSCAVEEVREYGVYSPSLGRNGSRLDISGERASMSVRFVFCEESGIRPLVEGGSYVFIPSGGREEVVGLEGGVGVLCDLGVVDVYIRARHGVGVGGEWVPVEVPYTFPSLLDGGVIVDLGGDVFISLGYSWIHFSWGGTKVPDEVRGFLGLPGGGPNPGFEAGGLVIGLITR